MTIECPKCQTKNPDETVFCGKCGTRFDSDVRPTQTLETPTEELKRGSVFAGRYEIIEELGKGGMGRVYRVDDTKAKEEIALKLIKPEIAADKKTIERFRNELTTARKIAHRNVCRMFDLGEEKEQHYITMEYVPGGDLKRLIRRTKRLDTGTAISIAKQICDGLEEAHSLGIVHRDLKPNNIMIDENGNARIMDFGIARTIKGKGITGSGVMIGTPEYMSPEQVEAKDVDQRSDIYSLGVILYEMTTGRLPFEADTPFAVGVKHKSESPQNPKELNPQLADDLSQVILKCLEKDKEKRYRSAGELRSELERIEQGLPTTERSVPPKKSVTSKEITVSFNVRKALIPLLLILAVAITSVFIWQPWGRRAAVPTVSDKTALAVLYFKNNTGDESLDNWRTALSDSIISDLSQSKYFEVLSSDRIFSILRKLNLLEASGYATEDLMDIASEGGVSHTLTGSLSKAGETYRIDYLIQEIPAGKTRGSDRVEGQGEASIFSMVDEITKNIKQDFNLSQEQIADDIDREVGTITTGSAEAFKYYSQGRQAHNFGEYKESIALMERAVAADPKFAMAFRSMAMAYGNISLYAQRDEYLKKAYELSDRLSDRERYIIEGDYNRRSHETYDKAIEAYDKLLELYPDDRIGNNNSALLYSAIEQWDKAIERYKMAIQNKDPSVVGYTGLASVYIYKGELDKARNTLFDYIENIQDSSSVRQDLAEIYTLQRKFDQALEEIDKAFSLDPTNSSNLFPRGRILYFRGDLEEAAIEFTKVLEREGPVEKVISNLGLLFVETQQGKLSESIERAKKTIELCRSFDQKVWEVSVRKKLGDIYLYLGKKEEALSQYDLAQQIAEETENLSQQWRLLVAKGIYYLKTSSIPEALEIADKLRESIESGLNEKAIRKYDYLMGLVEIEKKDYSGAVEHLTKAKNLLPGEYSGWDGHARISFALGQAYHRTGNLDNAQAAYEEILPMTCGREYDQIVYALAFFELGKVFQDQGNTAKAIEHYEKFLSLWKDADPGLPEVDDAKRRLAGLRE
jgi:serine/threonine protein kinase/Flp pilus assembly protein TadD